MTAPLPRDCADVLAVLDERIATSARLYQLAHDAPEPSTLVELREARAVVAELIEALKEARDALTDYDGHISNPDFKGGWDSDVGYAAYQRASAALARCGGAK